MSEASGQITPPRPNIVLITSDQHRSDCFGFAGRRVKTPHLDRMTRNGVRFTNAITPNLVCQPARASMLTGLLPLNHGVVDNEFDLDPKIAETGWARRLAGSGYRSVFIGKSHFGEDERATPFGAPESREQSARFPTDWSGPYMGFDHVELMILGHWHEFLPCERPPRGQHFERWFWGHGESGEAWRLWGESFEPRPSASQTWFSKLPSAWHSTSWVTERAIAAIRDINRAEPLCMWVSYPDPHHSFDCPEPWSRLHSADDVDISRTHIRDLDRRPWWHRAALENVPAAPNERIRILRTTYSRIEPQTDRQLAEMTANYYGMISFIDDGVGRILSAIQDTGLAENTIVIFTSDHGELLGDHGLYLKGPTPYDGVLKVGLLAQGPGVPAGHVVSEPVSTVDLFATFLDWAGLDSTVHAQSRSLRTLIRGGSDSRHAAYSEWKLHPRRAGVGLDLRTVRTHTAKLTLDLTSGAGEMYDLANDPDEMENLFEDRGKASLRAALEELLAQRPEQIS